MKGKMGAEKIERAEALQMAIPVIFFWINMSTNKEIFCDISSYWRQTAVEVWSVILNGGDQHN